MQLVVEDFESMAPVILTPRGGPMSDVEFQRFCSQYPDCMVECTAEGEILIMPPTRRKTGVRNALIIRHLGNWAALDRCGEVWDSSSGFRLPNGARRSAHAAWVRKNRIAALPIEQQQGFPGICPDFVIELRSESDRLKPLQAKMNEYMGNGAELGWLIDPIERKAWIYRPRKEVERLDDPKVLRGEGPAAGFVLEMNEIYE